MEGLISLEDLRSLARKYRALITIHHALASWDDARARTLDAAIAEEFPGALRELQTLDVNVLDDRARALEEAIAGGAPEPWMLWMADYHRTLRRLLADKRAGRLARAPGGRVNQLVMAELAARYGVPAAAIADALFPSRRR